MRVTRRKRKNSFIIRPIVIILVLLLVLCIGKNNSSFLNDLNNASIKAVNVIEKPFKKLNEYYKQLKIVLLTHIHQDHFNKKTISKLAIERPT